MHPEEHTRDGAGCALTLAAPLVVYPKREAVQRSLGQRKEAKLTGRGSEETRERNEVSRLTGTL